MAHAKYLLNNMDKTFQKLDSNTIRITETKPVIVDLNINDLLTKKAEYEHKIKEVDLRVDLALSNWRKEQEEYQNEIDKIDSIIAECEKLNIKSEKISLSEDTEVQEEKV